MMVDLNHTSGTVSVCKEKTFCKLSYVMDRSMSSRDQLENPVHFVSGAAQCMHLAPKNWYIQVCVLMRCLCLKK